MKYVKMLGLAAVAAMASMAFIGASSASGTVLCTTTLTSGCAATGWHYGAGTTIHLTQKAGTSTVVETESGTILETCTTSTWHATLENTGSSTETLKADNVTKTFGTGSTPCTRTIDTLGSSGTLEFHWISGTHNAAFTAKEEEWTINTIFGTCVYGSGAALNIGTITGGEEPEININTSVPKLSGNSLCPASARWTATFVLTTPHAGAFATN